MNGTLRKLKGGRHQVRWDVYVHDAVTGKKRRQQRARNFPKGHVEEARDFLRRLHAEPETPAAEAAPSPLTFGEFAADWLARYAKVEMSDGSYVTVESLVRVHYVPAFGSRPLASLRKVDLLDLRARLVTGGAHSTAMVNQITAYARKLLETAVDWDLLDANPWARVKPLKKAEQPFDTWTAAERDRFLVFARREDPDFARVVAFAVHTGLRVGEITGLLRSAVDYQRGVVTVRRIYSSKVKDLRDRTKGRRIRYVELNEVAAAAIADRQLTAFTSLVFEGFNINNAARRLRRIAKAAGVKPIKFHDLRHTFGTLMAEAGVDPFALQTIMGHADIKQTMRYVHRTAALSGETRRLVTRHCASSVDSSPRSESN